MVDLRTRRSDRSRRRFHHHEAELMIISLTGRSEQFTTAAGEVIPERIVPASISVNLKALAVVLVAAVVLLGGR